MNRKKAVSNEIAVADHATNEDLNDAVDKLCERTLDYIYNSWRLEYNYYRLWDKSHLDPRGTWSSSSRFNTFVRQYKPKFDKFMERFSRVGNYPKQDVLPDQTQTQTLPNIPNVERYQNFKQLDTVVDFSDHLFSTKPMEQPTESWVKHVGKQLKILKENLPETIFVRAYESRMDLLRAVIIGPKGTPYHDGLFFFDIYFPPNFPLYPPDVRYHSFGYGINPHFFECGEVCLNLYAVWIQPDEPLWVFLKTTVLQLLVNIQDRVLCADPLFLQPGLQDSGPSVVAEYFSLLYNEDVLIKSLKSMVHIMNKPPKNFEAFVLGHFCDRADDILMACKAYKEGCCSYEFQSNVDACLYEFGLNNALTSIRATVPADDTNRQGKKTYLDMADSNVVRGVKRSEHTWTNDEDAKLIDALMEIHASGKYDGADNGFKPCYLNDVQQLLDVSLPNSGLKADSHIKSRMKTWKTHFSIVYDTLHTSGFGWDEQKSCIIADDSVWDEYVKSHKVAAKFRDKPFLFYDKLCTIFGKDRATGSKAVDLGEEDVQEKQRSSHVDIEDFDFVEEAVPNAPRSEGPTGSVTNKRKRGRSKDADEIYRESCKDLKEELLRFGEMMCEQRCKEGIEAREIYEKVSDELKALPGITMKKRFKAAHLIGKDVVLGHSFLALTTEEKIGMIEFYTDGSMG